MQRSEELDKGTAIAMRDTTNTFLRETVNATVEHEDMTRRWHELHRAPCYLSLSVPMGRSQKWSEHVMEFLSHACARVVELQQHGKILERIFIVTNNHVCYCLPIVRFLTDVRKAVISKNHRLYVIPHYLESRAPILIIDSYLLRLRLHIREASPYQEYQGHSSHTLTLVTMIREVLQHGLRISVQHTSL